MVTFESLPVELIADILGELDLESLIKLSYLSKRFHCIAADPSLNPWRRPILRNLRSDVYEPCMKHLSVRATVPRRNWLEILSLARADFILFEATLPNLRTSNWEECFKRRFLPSWKKGKGSWKETFVMMLHRVWHRSHTSCTTDEAWTKYILLNRNGSANQLESPSRGFSPFGLFEQFKFQSNLGHLETRVRLVVEFSDVRILVLGVLNRARSPFSVNHNAHLFLHPPGIEKGLQDVKRGEGNHHNTPVNTRNLGLVDGISSISSVLRGQTSAVSYTRLTHPLPAASHARYPFYTPGGKDKRWVGPGEFEENGLQWVGGLMVTAQIFGPCTRESYTDGPVLQDSDLVSGPGRRQYCSFTWPDLWAIAPWMEDKISKKIDGPGLGH